MAVQSLFPILNTRDLPRLVNFYENALGATVVYRYAAGDVDDYVSLQLGPASLGIGRVPDAAVPRFTRLPSQSRACATRSPHGMSAGSCSAMPPAAMKAAYAASTSST